MNEESTSPAAQLPPGYSHIETLSSGSQARLLRVNAPARVSEFALVKLPGKLAKDWNNWATRDSELSRVIESESILTPLETESHRDQVLPVFADFAGQSLETLIRPEGLRLRAFLRLAIRIIDGLQDIHNQDIIHNDLQPANILVNVETGEIRITGFGRAQLSSIIEAGNPARAWNKLHYLSPEQSGRVNRPIDFRSDYYSLAAILYELLCGRPPFLAGDALELIHAHVAQQATPPRELRPEIPRVLSDIVLRNLAKSADDRYRSLAGLRSDLCECLRQLRTGQSIEYFAPGALDAAERYYPPRRLFGRERELRRLRKDFERSARGAPVLTLVRGHSGIGKSALVREISVQIFERRGVFVEGKFDQLQRDIPYHAILQALRGFVRSILSGSEQQLEDWKAKLGDKLRHSAPVLGQVIPELAWLLGKLPAPPEAGLNETGNRFYLAFQELLEAVAAPEHPLVVFLDDLQWADEPSFELIRRLMQELRPGVALHIVGAYRDNEVDETHPLSAMLSKIRESTGDAEAAPRSIKLGPLSEANVNLFVAEALRIPADHASSLAGVVASFSGGNPLLAGEFLKSLIEEGRLRFDRKNRSWDWDSDAIRALDLAENIIDFMAQKIARLDEASRRLLNTAACYGNRFRMPVLLATHSELTPAKIHSLLEPAARMGFLLFVRGSAPVEERPAGDAGLPGSFGFEYRFVHDRVQQVVYELMTPEERTACHLAIGRSLQTKASGDDIQERIFDITHHLNLARDLISLPAERKLAATLNLQAGRRALASIAPDSATRLLSNGIAYLPQRAWDREYELTLALKEELARARQLSGAYDEAETLVDEILDNTVDPLHRVSACETRVRARNNQNRLQDSLAAARIMLRELGVRLPEKGGRAGLLRALLSAKLAVLLNGGPESILRSAEMRNPRKRAAVRILTQIGSTAYQSDPDLFAIVVLLLATLSYRYGIAPDTPYGVALYAVAHSGTLAAPVAANRYIECARTLLERPEYTQSRTRILVIQGAFVTHWTAAMKASLPPLIEAAGAGRISGDAEFRGYSFFFQLLNEFFSTGRLDVMARETRTALTELRRQRTSQSLYVTLIWLQTVSNLRAADDDNAMRLKTTLDGEYFAQQSQLKTLTDLSYHTAVAWVHQSNALLHFLNDEARLAVQSGAQACAMIKSINASSSIPPLYFIDGLSRLLACRAPDIPRREAREHRRIIRRIRKRFARWSREAPANQMHRRHALEAEWHRTAGAKDRAMHHYELAAQAAQKNDFVMDFAIINELAGGFCAQENRAVFARSYLSAAVRAYSEWGCPLKAARIVREYPQFVEKTAGEIEAYNPAAKIPPRSELADPGAGAAQNRSLDMDTVMKAVETISEEIHLETLLDRLIHIVMENSGARRGALIVAENGKLSVAARADLELVRDRHAVREASRPLANEKDLPVGVIQYVARTRELVLFDEPAAHRQLKTDAYWQTNDPPSALCVPIVHQNQLFGVFYLENELTAGVFDRSRMEIIRFLNTHVAISLRNARLYREQQELTKSFARFLPNQFLEFLEKRDVREVRLGDSVQQNMIVLFSDIRDFTTISETMNARDNFRFLNSYFKRIEPAILRNQGFIDKFIGDAVMALFSYSPKNALNAALDMRSELAAFNRHRLISGLAPLEIGIGLHAGDVMLGTVGSSNRMETTVIGDTVNLASRIESLTKSYAASILVTGELREQLKTPEAFDLREIDSVRVRGKTRPVVLYELCSSDDPDRRAQKLQGQPLFAEGLAAYRAGDFTEAGRVFRAGTLATPLDPLPGIFSRRCEALALQPPEDWDGVWSMHSHS